MQGIIGKDGKDGKDGKVGKVGKDMDRVAEAITSIRP
jgi:hypothetical protein